MELKNADVDINPQYADSLDAEIFKLHLMFDNSTRNENPGPNQTIVLPEYATLGPNSFKSGLDEVSIMTELKLHMYSILTLSYFWL
jgi:hypothetical protein